MQTCKTELWQKDLWHFFAWRSERGGGLYSLHDLRSTLTFVKVMSSNSIISVSASRSERQIAAAAGLCWYRQNVFAPPPLWRQRAGRASPRSAARSFKAALKWGEKLRPGHLFEEHAQSAALSWTPRQLPSGSRRGCTVPHWSVELMFGLCRLDVFTVYVCVCLFPSRCAKTAQESTHLKVNSHSPPHPSRCTCELRRKDAAHQAEQPQEFKRWVSDRPASRFPEILSAIRRVGLDGIFKGTCSVDSPPGCISSFKMCDSIENSVFISWNVRRRRRRRWREEQGMSWIRGSTALLVVAVITLFMLIWELSVVLE